MSLACSTVVRGGTCPVGFYCKDGLCECGAHPGNVIHCSRETGFVLLRSYCLTFDEEAKIASAGLCLHHRNVSYFGYGYMYYQLNMGMDGHLLNKMMCGDHMNRTGTLCGRCLPDHYPLAYSFEIYCIRCPNARWNWVRYIMAAYLPLTVFYLAVLFLKLNTTSSHLFAFVYYCQTLSLPALVRGAFVGRYGSAYITAIRVYTSFYGVWNLDFFRPFYSDLCLGIGILPTLALDYAIAVYPLLLMIISYLLIVLYDRNCRVIVILWRPFRALFSLFKKKWAIRTSIIDSFATFFFLSNTRFLSVSFDLLVPTRVYHLYGDTYNYTTALYYSGDIEYFGREHLPYAILAIVMLCVFFILPVAILAFYPFKFFQKTINAIPFSWYILHTFVDSFQGCYKDGTEPGTRDCRWFASVFFISRLGYITLYFLTPIDLFTSLIVVVLIFHTTLLAVFRPFKPSLNRCNTINLIFLQFLTLFVALHACGEYISVFKPDFSFLVFSLMVICVIAPVVYALMCPILWVYAHRRFGVHLVHRLRARITGYTPLVQPILPDRIENSSRYHRENLANFAANK